MFGTFFSENRAVYVIMWESMECMSKKIHGMNNIKKCGTAVQATDGNTTQRMRIVWLIPQASDTN